MKKIFNTVLSLAAVITIAGCQNAPQAELEAARNALMRADSVEADVYVGDLYVAALDSFNAAQSEIEVEDAKSGFSRNYGHAAELLAFTEQTAMDAAAQVDERRDAVRAEADSLIAYAQAALTATPAGTASTVTDSGLPSAAALINDATAALDTGDYKAARDLAQAAIDQINQSATPAIETAPRS